MSPALILFLIMITLIIGFAVFFSIYQTDKKLPVYQVNNKLPVYKVDNKLPVYKVDNKLPVNRLPVYQTKNTVENVNLIQPIDGKKYVYRERSIKMPEYGFDLPIKDRFVSAHNFFRRCVPELKWNSDLAKLAENWGRKIANENIMRDIVASWQEEKNIPNFDQTIISLTNHTITFSPTLNERKQQASEVMAKITRPNGCQGIEYNFQNHKCNPNNLYGHMTQVVWKDSREVGCSQVVGKDRQTIFSVCNYFPAGNVIGQYEQNVLDPNNC